MKKFKLVLFLLLTSFLSLGIVSPQMKANAATPKVVQVVKTVKATPKKYVALGGYLYSSSKLTKQVFNLKNYSKTVFTVKKTVTVKLDNGKTQKIVYVDSANKKMKGFAYPQYLKEYQENQPISETKLNDLINSFPDLDPSGQLLCLTSQDYVNYKSLFDEKFNLLSGGLSGFKNHQEILFVKDPDLLPFVQAGVNIWNKALGSQVFIVTTTPNENAVSISFQPTNDGWDGITYNSEIHSNSVDFFDSNYRPNNWQIYWTGAVVHELGHRLGLNHTPYRKDILAAPESADGKFTKRAVKYAWKNYADPENIRAVEIAQLSKRDIDRAKLTKLLGYW